MLEAIHPTTGEKLYLEPLWIAADGEWRRGDESFVDTFDQEFGSSFITERATRKRFRFGSLSFKEPPTDEMIRKEIDHLLATQPFDDWESVSEEE